MKYVSQLDPMGLISDKYKPYIDKNKSMNTRPGTTASGGAGQTTLPSIATPPTGESLSGATAAQRELAEKKRRERLADSQRRQLERHYRKIREEHNSTKFQMKYSMLDLTRPSSAQMRKGEAHRVTKKDGQYC